MSPLQKAIVVSEECTGPKERVSESSETNAHATHTIQKSLNDNDTGVNQDTENNSTCSIGSSNTSSCDNKNTKSNTQNNKYDISNLTFLERVRLAMRSSKTPISTSTVVGRVPDTLLSKDESNSSISSNATNLSTLTSPPSTPSPRPPLPPKDPNRLRKQLKLIPMTSRSKNYESEDNLHTNQLSTSKSKSNNEFTTPAETVDNNHIDFSTVPVDVKLKLPLPKLDTSVVNASSAYSFNENYTRSSSDRLRLLTRSPSPALSTKSTSSRTSSIGSSIPTTRSSLSRLQTPPRRVFPQTYTQGNQFDAYEIRNLEQSPVVFDANLSFVLGCRKQPVHQSFRPSPSFEDSRTASAFLSEKIQNFLKRTDHVQEEWSALGKRSRNRSAASNINSRGTTPTNSIYDDSDPLSETISLIERQRERNSMERCPYVRRTQSSQNILTKAFQLSKVLPKTPTSRPNSLARDILDLNDDTEDDLTIQEDDNELDEV